MFECFPKNYTEFSMCTTPIENPHNNANVFSYTLEKYIEVPSFGQAASGTSNICPNITFMWQISPQVQIITRSRLASLPYTIQTESFFWQLPCKEKKKKLSLLEGSKHSFPTAIFFICPSVPLNKKQEL